jgi:hypothetical protein
MSWASGARGSDARFTPSVTIRVCDCPRPQDGFAVWTKLFEKLL